MQTIQNAAPAATAAYAPTYGPPRPLMLDGVAFFNAVHEREEAWRDGRTLIGEIDLDEQHLVWKARRMRDGVFGGWHPMRSPAEARAFIVSSRATWFSTELPALNPVAAA